MKAIYFASLIYSDPSRISIVNISRLYSYYYKTKPYTDFVISIASVRRKSIYPFRSLQMRTSFQNHLIHFRLNDSYIFHLLSKAFINLCVIGFISIEYLCNI
jgi:hypothetical protein